MVHDRISYLDEAAASDAGRDYKTLLLDRLELGPGLTVLDVGCGPGTDLPSMAGAVGDSGAVIGVDNDDAMVAEATRRMAADPRIEVRTGDAHALPLDDASVDRARTDRVLQHVADPAKVLAQLHRAVRPGGSITLAEPDWDTLIVDDGDVETSRAYSKFVATQVIRNGAIGRQLARLAAQAGFTVRAVDVKPVVFLDFATADRILRPASVAERAVRAGAMAEDATSRWLGRLTEGPFLAAFNLFVVTAELARPL
ncbi:MAG TPA: methyltransferase domain-containing protein [Candidatus Limnocylindrales bacterium]